MISSVAYPRADYCEDLAELACSPTDSVDDTGTALADSESPVKDVDQFYIARMPVYQGWFKQILQKDEGQYFQRQALFALGLQKEYPCDKVFDVKLPRPDLEDKCRDLLAKNLVRVTRAQLLPGHEEVFQSSTALQDLGPMLRSGIYTSIKDRINQDIQGTFKEANLKSRIRDKIMPRAKQLIVAKIERMDIPDATKSRMKMKVKGIQFDGTDCSEQIDDKARKHSLDGLFYQAAYYDPKSNVFRFCDGLGFLGDSESMLLSIVGHELAHSIDPCQMQIGYEALNDSYSSRRAKAESQVPYPMLLRCLRDPKSIGAKVDSLLASEAPFYLRMIDLEGILHERDGPQFCGHDQIGECIADWFAFEALGQHIAETRMNKSHKENLAYVKNTFRALCPTPGKKAKGSKFYVHPKTYDRINRLLIRQPEVRKSIGCPSENKKYGYCDGAVETPRFQPTISPVDTSINEAIK